MPVDTSIQLLAHEIPDIDAKCASRFLNPQKGCTVVECWPARDKTASGLVIPSGVAEAYRNRPDIGTVLASHPEIPLIPGDVVLFNHEHGKRISGFSAGDYVTDNEVRIFGRSVLEDSGVRRISWRRSMMARLDNLENGVKGARIRPVGDWVLVRRDDLHDKHEVGGTDIQLHLPASATYRSTKGTVVAVGEMVEDLERGDRVIYLANPVKTLEPVRHLIGLEDKNLVLMVEGAILCKVEGEADIAEAA